MKVYCVVRSNIFSEYDPNIVTDIQVFNNFEDALDSAKSVVNDIRDNAEDYDIDCVEEPRIDEDKETFYFQAYEEGYSSRTQENVYITTTEVEPTLEAALEVVAKEKNKNIKSELENSVKEADRESGKGAPVKSQER